MDLPDSSMSRSQSDTAEDGRAPSSCSLQTTALPTNLDATPPSRTPLSTVAVQAAFHKHRTHTERNPSHGPQRKHSTGSGNAAPPTNIPYVRCVPAPLVAALIASSATAVGENVDPQEQHQQPSTAGSFQQDVKEYEDDSNPTTDASPDYQTGHMCHVPEPPFLSTRNRDRELDVSSQASRDSRGVGVSIGTVHSNMGNGAFGSMSQRKIVPTNSGPGKYAPEPSRTLGPQSALSHQHGIDPENSTGRPFGPKSSECVLDMTSVRPQPASQQIIRNNTDIIENAPGGPLKPISIKNLPATMPTQGPSPTLPRQQSVSGGTGNAGSPDEQEPGSDECPSDSPTQRSQSGPSRQTILSGGTADSVGGVPQPPPPPPPSPGKISFKDPACDPDNPFILQFQDVTSAAFMIRNAITVTPCVHSRLSRMSGMDVFLKKEFMQLTGSFKERGARYALLMLTPEQRATGIVAASLGNHALALACHGAQLGIPVTVVMPTRAPLAKVSACRAYGANVIIEGDDMGHARNMALELAHNKGLTYINGYDHPHILAGQGTLGLELLEQVCDVDAIVIPVGGGGLLAGVSRAVKTLYPNITIIAVESENCPSFSAAQAAGKPVLTECLATIADGLAVPMVGVNAFASASPLVDRTIVVNEDLIALSILRMVEVEKNVVEGAGAAGVAATLSGQMDDFKGKRVVVLACGGNIDVSMLGRCLDRGLVADGRLFSFTVFVDQKPTGLSDLFCLISRLGASIKDMTHDRKWESEYFFHFPVKIVVETPGASTSRELRTVLSQMYKKIIFHHNFEPITSHQPMYPDFPNLDCGGAERTSRRDANSPMITGLSALLTSQTLEASVASVPGDTNPTTTPLATQHYKPL